MDSRQRTQQYPNNNASPANAGYSFSAQQNDPFHAFVNSEEGASFDPSWTGQTFSNHASNIDGFDQSGQAWQQSPYQNSNLLSMPGYAVPSREYDQTYSRNPSYNYQAFEPDPNPVFTNPTYNNSLDFNQDSLHDRFGYPAPARFAQSNETISPQALQNYSSLQHVLVPQQRQNQNQPQGSVQPRGGVETIQPQVEPLTRQEWINLVAPNSASIYRGGLHIKPTEAYSNATNSTRLDGFIFVGNNEIALNTTKAAIPRHKKKKSRNEAIRLLEREKGDVSWHRDREPLMKRLKEASVKMAGSKSARLTPSSRSGSAAETSSSSDSPDSESEEESEDNSASDVESEVDEPSPVPLTRPADPNKAKEYDLIKTVWAKRRTVLSPTVIRTALAECWDIFKDIRDKWKVKLANLQQAIEKKDAANKSVYERRVIEQRKLLESCIRLTLKHGHPSIVEKVGESPHLLVAFYQFLADRFKDGEHTGSFIASILELIARCNSVDAALLEKTKFDKLLSRLLKKGDEQGKALAQRIFDGATAVKKQKALDASDSKDQPNGNLKREQSNSASADVTKPVANNPKKSAEADKKGSKVSTGGKSVVAAAQPGSEADSSKVKVVQSAAKPSSFFAGLQSASKKPGTATKGKEGRQSTEIVAKAEEAKPLPKPAFSFAATMATLVKPKEVQPTKLEDARKPETPEEKRKRTRKEQRRGLRVSFKSDSELVQIREFVHDPEEEMGHEASQVKDVGDSRGEGQVLRMHKDLDLMDEDEDYEPPEEIEMSFPWIMPTATDFSVIDEADLERNYIRRGGHLEPESSERKIQEQRDSSTLMVIYSTFADIPPTPREQTEIDVENGGQEQKFGEVGDLVKKREAEYRAHRYIAPPSNILPTPDVSSILRILNNQNQAQPPPQPPSQAPTTPSAASAGLQALLAQFANNNINSHQQNAQASMVQQPATTPNFNLQATLATMTQATPGQQQYQPQPAYGTAPSSQGTPDLQSILAQFNPQRQAQASQAQNFGFGAGNQFNDNDRKRTYDGADPDEHGGGKKAKSNGQAEKKKFSTTPRLPCKFWQEGKCRKGDECTYLHE